MENNSILSPVMLWRGHRLKYPLQAMKTSEEVFDNVIYTDVYFSGRETKNGRVRIFGTLAKTRGQVISAKTAGLLILPDASATIDLNIVKYYVKQGYVVFMIDYRGFCEKIDNFTQYPECISYANYFERGRAMDHCDRSASETCWYEWTSVAKYAFGFMQSQGLTRIGVIGIGSGSDIGWQLCSTETGGINCFVSLFCAGGRAYKGYYKNGETDMPMNDERVRFLAGVDSSAYTQYMEVPTLFMTASNSPVGDPERALDSMSRVPDSTIIYRNCAPRLRDVLDIHCKRNIEIFLAKFLYDFPVSIPSEPELIVKLEDKRLLFSVEESDSSTFAIKKVTAYVAEGAVDPSYRFWTELKPAAVAEGKQAFKYVLTTDCPFVSVFAVVSYKNGFTLSTKMVTQKVKTTGAKKGNILYAGKKGLDPVCLYSLKERSEAGLFFTEQMPVSIYQGAGGIKGVTSDCTMIFYQFNSGVFDLHDRTILKLDVISTEHCVLKITIITEKLGETTDYSSSVTIKRGNFWKDVTLKLSDFKSDTSRSIDDVNSIVALKFESDVKYAVNNILVI